MSGSAAAAVRAALERLDRDPHPTIWIERRRPDAVLADAELVDRRAAAGDDLPLRGRTVAVKGNIDLVGMRTTAGCPEFGQVAPRSAAVIEALEQAGAVVLGSTHMDQFATGLVGARSPAGPCPNPQWPGRISGGSSSGSAAAVAAGLVDIGIGTDTAGSGRVPAAANGIFGVKPTKGRLPATGVVPACRSLDCVSVFARSAELAGLTADLAASADPTGDHWWRPAPHAIEFPASVRVGVPSIGIGGFDGSHGDMARFEQAVAVMIEALGALAVPVDLTPFLDAGRLLYEGAFVAERYAAVGEFVATADATFDPTVREIILRSASLPAWRVFQDLDELRRLRCATDEVWTAIDVLVVPSVPRVPTVAEVEADPLGVNSMLGTYTNFVNLLDLAALTMPVRLPPGGTDDGSRPPASLTLIGRAWSDQALVTMASRSM